MDADGGRGAGDRREEQLEGQREEQLETVLERLEEEQRRLARRLDGTARATEGNREGPGMTG